MVRSDEIKQIRTDRLHRPAHATSHWRLRGVLAALGVPDGLVNGKNKAGGLRGGGQRVDLHDRRFPDAALHVIRDILRIYVDAVPLQTFVVLLAQFIQNICRVEPSVIAQLPVIDTYR